MRKSTLSGAALAALMVLAVALPAAARSPIALGIATPEGTSVAALDSHLAAIGANTNPARTPSLWTIWSQWGDNGGDADCSPDLGASTTCDFPTAMLDLLASRGMSGIVWWQPYDPADPFPGGARYARHKRTFVNGANDAYIKAWAKAAKAFGQSHPGRMVYVRMAHEANGDYFDWRKGNFDNTAQTFKKFWKYVWQIFENQGANEFVKWVWSVRRPTCEAQGCNPYQQYYPGNQFVDYVDVPVLNWGKAGGPNAWEELKQAIKRPYKNITEFTNKPWLLCEVASAPDNVGKTKAHWLKSGYKHVYDKLGKVKGIVYLDTNRPQIDRGHPDWRLANPGTALAAYAELTSKPKFQGDL